jgi:peptidoglycan-associated lipoprotein
MNQFRLLSLVFPLMLLTCPIVGCAGRTSGTGGIVKESPDPSSLPKQATAEQNSTRQPRSDWRQNLELKSPPANTGALESSPDRRLDLDTGGTSLDRVYFPFDHYTLTSQAREILADNAEHLHMDRDARIRIEGHCDERGTTEYNLALGERRAVSAYDYLRDLGVAPDRMSVLSFSEERPLDSEHNEEAWALNRRAEFVKVEP